MTICAIEASERRSPEEDVGVEAGDAAAEPGVAGKGEGEGAKAFELRALPAAAGGGVTIALALFGIPMPWGLRSAPGVPPPGVPPAAEACWRWSAWGRVKGGGAAVADWPAGRKRAPAPPGLPPLPPPFSPGPTP